MSTSETVEWTLGKCPCGLGEIVNEITTQDNPWSSADSNLFIRCERCASEWRIEHRHLVKKGSDSEYKAAWAHELACAQQVTGLLAD